MRSLIRWLCLTGLVLAMAASAAPVRDGYPPEITGLIYKDPTSKVILYVETDGRHVVAISEDGKILWRKNPFVDAGLEPYRTARPTITILGSCHFGCSTTAKAVWLEFSSSQMGELDIATGTFRFMGQN